MWFNTGYLAKFGRPSHVLVNILFIRTILGKKVFMELVFSYDKFRLNHYSLVQPDIAFYENETLQAFCFPEVSYFNYAFRKDNLPLSESEIETVLGFYKRNNVSKFKLLSESGLINNYSNRLVKTQTFVKHRLLEHKPVFKSADLKFLEVDEDSIAEFTAVYLESFEAEKRNLNSVIRNFTQLLNQANLCLFLVQHQLQSVGVVVLFKEESTFLLAGGAILPTYRNNTFHQEGIDFRIGKCLKINPNQTIESWTYLNSTSMNNMLRCGLQIDNLFDVYEFT